MAWPRERRRRAKCNAIRRTYELGAADPLTVDIGSVSRPKIPQHKTVWRPSYLAMPTRNGRFIDHDVALTGSSNDPRMTAHDRLLHTRQTLDTYAANRVLWYVVRRESQRILWMSAIPLRSLGRGMGTEE